ncbi:MAG: acyltransferase [Flavitalea sp.]
MRVHRANLDLLRATAITVVFIHHVGQYLEGIPEIAHQIMAFGGFGVDLFFVLSGWLIGGIFFREYGQKGSVNLTSFWARRWFRTMPPYYAALILSWAAVFVARREPFDLRFLFFLQNYSDLVPYFKISWSLCIEEHFYLFLPLFLLLFLRVKLVPYACLALILLSFGLRVYHTGPEYPKFGYLITATHFRLDGLVSGVLCAYVYYLKPASWKTFSSWLMGIGLIGGCVSLTLYALDSTYLYSFGILALSACFAGLLCLCVNKSDWAFARTRAVYAIAISSYSIYLVHALLINVCYQYMKDRGVWFTLASIGLTVIFTYIFHASVEEVSKKLRDRFFPSPAPVPAPELPAGMIAPAATQVEEVSPVIVRENGGITPGG